MNTKRSGVLLMGMLVTVLGLGACSHVRNDADVTADVQARIHEYAALKTASITVQCNNGVVVLSGNVDNDAARSLTGNVSRQVEGVKGVVNNLQVVTVAAKLAPAQPKRAAQPGARRQAPKPSVEEPAKPAQAAAAGEKPTAAAPAAQVATAQLSQAAPAQVTIPEGTMLTVRLIEPVNSEKNKQGDTFRVSLDSPIVIQDKTVIPKDADAEAKLVSAKSAGHFKGSSAIVLVLTRITVAGKTYELQTGEFSRKGASRGKRSAAVIGGGTAAGAAIGAIAGGGKGAAIGAAAGAGAGAGVQALTKGQQIKLPAETLLEFELKTPLTVTSTSNTAKQETAG